MHCKGVLYGRGGVYNAWFGTEHRGGHLNAFYMPEVVWISRGKADMAIHGGLCHVIMLYECIEQG